MGISMRLRRLQLIVILSLMILIPLVQAQETIIEDFENSQELEFVNPDYIDVFRPIDLIRPLGYEFAHGFLHNVSIFIDDLRDNTSEIYDGLEIDVTITKDEEGFEQKTLYHGENWTLSLGDLYHDRSQLIITTETGNVTLKSRIEYEFHWFIAANTSDLEYAIFRTVSHWTIHWQVKSVTSPTGSGSPLFLMMYIALIVAPVIFVLKLYRKWEAKE